MSLRSQEEGASDQHTDQSALQWFYPRAQFARGALQEMVTESDRTMKHVCYPVNAVLPERSAQFRISGHGGAILAASTGTVRDVGGRVVEVGDNLVAGSEAVLTVEAASGPCAIALSGQTETVRVETRLLGTSWELADQRLGSSVPPHTAREPVNPIELAPQGDGLFLAPLPVMGQVVIECSPDSAPVLTVGESKAEALAAPAAGEARTDLVEDSPGRWVSRHRLAVLYAHAEGAGIESIQVLAHTRRFPRRGAFVCSDPELTRMWTVAATTLGTVMQTLVVDGIKRDRVPWLTDNASAILPNAYAFGDRQIIRDGINALLRSRRGYANGIADYTLWGIFALSLVLDHFDDVEFLREVEPDLRSVMNGLMECAGEDGLLRTVKDQHSFPESGPGGVFLDWGVTLDPQRVSTAFQALWFAALNAASRVVAACGSVPDPQWEQCSHTVSSTLSALAWDPMKQAWREYVDGVSAPVPLANTLATLASLPHDSDDIGVLTQILATASGTPSMRAWSLRAAAHLGARTETLAQMLHLWGSMLGPDTATFWEEFDLDGKSSTEMYGRPFGKSLCHGWSSGPAELLPSLVLGATPLSPGWREFTVDPLLGELEWASAVIPTATGDICVVATHNRLDVDIPEGVELVFNGERFTGVAHIDLTTQNR
ncbi:alpha-L-rhamnosidase C-terminal domain-containing protein [Schaalia vaccimaxillae]|uniref:alpha-L-rhamnosidase C-terminal domain-containing protein n=1 Tax=Schaalia vaccimaxillae TaxID=183916 RepID=UPI00103F0EB0|nr:alpha-L-rhamnosidase C-terminal domain-containing protein [Schaalia vaccimaxillae]